MSLLPAATEIVAALGAGAWLVGVSHECDYPPGVVRGLPRVTRTTIDASSSSADIDRQTRAARQTGVPPIIVDQAALAALAPDLIVGQSVCDVCAVGESQLAAALAALPVRPGVVTLHAHRLDDVFADIRRVGEAVDLRDEAEELVLGLRYRLGRIAGAPRTAHRNILVLEWLDPPYVAGHWVPDLVAAAGGVDVAGTAGARSVSRPWRELVALRPDRVIVALCGFDVPRARRELDLVTDPDARALLAAGVSFLDGNAYTSRPGPRLVDAAQLLAALIRG